MELQDILNKYPRSHTGAQNRTAELAALIVSRSAMNSCPENWDSERTPVHIKLPDMLSPHIAAHIAVLLVNRAEQLHKLAEHDCNFGMTTAQEKRADKLKAEVAEIAKFCGFDAETSGDPRGAVVKLIDPTGQDTGDNFGGGWGVYR